MGKDRSGRGAEVRVWGSVTAGPPKDSPAPRFRGRRHGRRLRPGRQTLLQTLLPKLRVPRGDDDIDLRRLFDFTPTAVWLEIGFGAGEHLVAAAKARPDIGFVGCEPYVNGVAALLASIDRAGIRTIRIFDDDVRLLLPRLPIASLGRVFILFPDPWPKKRHAGRRIVSAATIDALADGLADGAELRFASDDRNYVRETLALMTMHPSFDWPARTPGEWRTRCEDWPPSRYEQKALDAGRTGTYLRFVRKPRDSVAFARGQNTLSACRQTL